MVTYTICKYKVKGKYSKFSIQIKRRNWMCYLQVHSFNTGVASTRVSGLYSKSVPHSGTWPFKTKVKKKRGLINFEQKSSFNRNDPQKYFLG